MYVGSQKFGYFGHWLSNVRDCTLFIRVTGLEILHMEQQLFCEGKHMGQQLSFQNMYMEQGLS